MTKKKVDIARYKRFIKNRRDKIEPEAEEVTEEIVRPLDSFTFYQPDGGSLPNLLRDILSDYGDGRSSEEETVERLVRASVNPSFEANKVWLKKIAIEYFYGKKFARVNKFINEAKVKEIYP